MAGRVHAQQEQAQQTARRAAPKPAPRAARPEGLAVLQRTVGNQVFGQLARSLSAAAQGAIVGSAGTQHIQRDIDSAALAFYEQGVIQVKTRMLNRPFCKTHNITQTDLKQIQQKLNELREERGGRQQRREVLSVADPDNRPTQGGMVEEDAKVIAELQGWEQVDTEFTCTDPSHTPKGKVYFGRENRAYYGADNTGHVGWGFKVWTKRNRTTLDYKGNLVWDGRDWKHIPRGT